MGALGNNQKENVIFMNARSMEVLFSAAAQCVSLNRCSGEGQDVLELVCVSVMPDILEDQNMCKARSMEVLVCAAAQCASFNRRSGEDQHVHEGV